MHQKCNNKKIQKKGGKEPKNAALLAFLASFWEPLKKNSLGLSATKKQSVYRSDSVQQTKQIFVTVTQCDTQYFKKYIQFLCCM